jgi:peptide/nickel transport system permease protein
VPRAGHGGVSLPTFFTGILLIYVFYYLLGWAPSPLGRLDFIYFDPPRVTGFFLIDSSRGDLQRPSPVLRQLALPAVTLSLFTLAPIARMTRAAMLSALSSDYIRTARAAGLTPRKVLFGYAFRNALLPVVTTLGMVFSFVLGRQCAGGKGFRLARHRLLCGRGAGGVGLRRGAGFRPGDGALVRASSTS